MNEIYKNISYEDCKMFINDYPYRRYEKKENQIDSLFIFYYLKLNL